MFRGKWGTRLKCRVQWHWLDSLHKKAPAWSPRERLLRSWSIPLAWERGGALSSFCPEQESGSGFHDLGNAHGVKLPLIHESENPLVIKKASWDWDGFQGFEPL